MQSQAHAGDTAAIAVLREGTGPEVLLVHGGASPATTWSGLEHLSQRWTLAYVYRRGFAPSPPPPDGRQDFNLDADDLAPLLERRPHIVGHSYGTLGALLATARRPRDVRSLTLIEPPLFYLVPNDPDVARLERWGEEVVTYGLDADPQILRAFLRLAGSPGVDEGPLPDEVVRGVRRAHGSRSPAEARPQLHIICEAGLPSLVVSGAHHPAMERMCDAVAIAIGAQRAIAPGAGHFVAAAPGFADQIEQFFRSAG